MMGYGWGMGGFGMILFWILALLAIVWLVRALDLGKLLGGNDQTPKADRAHEILRERYARGDIDAEEFERRNNDLTRPLQRETETPSTS